MRSLMSCVALLMLCPAALAEGIELTVQLPPGARPASAVATAVKLKLQSRAAVAGQAVRFSDLLLETHYDLEITLDNGVRLRGADMGWDNDEPAQAGAGPLDEGDFRQIEALVSQVRQFYDKSQILLIRGDHDRATALVQQIRDSSFHSDRGDEVIWRVEIWHFTNRHGGWERVSQTNRILDRQRYPSAARYRQETGQMRWLPQLGGIVLPKDQPKAVITVPSLDPPSTRPAAGPADAPLEQGKAQEQD